MFLPPFSLKEWQSHFFSDLNILASLANYFDVSTDELLGMEKQRSDFFSEKFHRTINILIKEERYDEAVAQYREAQKTYPNHTGINSGLAMTLALRNETSDRDEAVQLCKRILGDLQYEKNKTSIRTILYIIMKNTMNREETLAQVRRLTHIWESREMITAELYSGKERTGYLKGLCHLLISLLYEKIEKPQLSDTELIKMIAVGPLNQTDDKETTLKRLCRIRDFISE